MQRDMRDMFSRPKTSSSTWLVTMEMGVCIHCSCHNGMNPKGKCSATGITKAHSKLIAP